MIPLSFYDNFLLGPDLDADILTRSGSTTLGRAAKFDVSTWKLNTNGLMAKMCLT